MKYQIKKQNELTENEIENLLKLWDIPAWNSMQPIYFRSFFKDYEFHFLLDANEDTLAVIRLNFDFILEISGKHHHFTEAVGLVSSKKKNGFGTKLIQFFTENITQRSIEVIGFCLAELRPFYKKCAVDILPDKARMIKEKSGSEWITSEDDDILIFNLSEENRTLLNRLGSENNAYLL